MTRRQLFTPKGVRDYLPREAAWRREIQNRIYNVFFSYGYEEVVTPTIEVLALFGRGNEADDTWIYRFIDRDGELIALRPDMTTPIARLVSAHLRHEPLPLRLCYFGNLFRYADPQAGRQREFTQAGVELLGSARPEADAEVITLACRALESVGIRDFRFDIGHVGFVQSVLSRAGLPPETEEAIKRALIHKDLVRLEQLAADSVADPALRGILCELESYRGGPEVLERARRALPGGAIPALTDLASIYGCLECAGIAEKITIDLGMAKEMDYYTGMIMEGYSRELGYYLCSGGRYDRLLGEFGYNLPATGFALGVDRALLVLERQGFEGWNSPLRIEARFPAEVRAEFYEWVERWRRMGIVVVNGFGEEESLRRADGWVEFLANGRIVWHQGAKQEEMDPEDFDPSKLVR